VSEVADVCQRGVCGDKRVFEVTKVYPTKLSYFLSGLRMKIYALNSLKVADAGFK
jgi:hypothetical protein